METTRYKLHITYDGTHFAGFQIQPNGRTVQGEIERALKMMSKGQMIRIRGAGRTDAGVHAKGQVIHFDYPQQLPPEAMQRALNTLVPEEIVCWHSEIVSKEFHAQYSAVGKTYQYRVHNRWLRDPFLRNITLQHPYPMNEQKVKDALRVLEGKHDFTSFSSTRTDKENKVRTLYEASLEVDEIRNQWLFTFKGDGFLYNMIRIIMGTVLQIGDGRRKPEEMKQILEARNRKKAGPTASPKGLCLMEVHYPE